MLCHPQPHPWAPGGSFPSPLPTAAADRPQGCTLAPRPAVSPWGGHPAHSQTSSHLSCRLAIPSPAPRLRVPLPPHPRGPPPAPQAPLPCCQRTRRPPHPWRLALGGLSRPALSPPTPQPQHPVLCLPAVTVEGIWYEANRKQKPNPIYAISVCLYLTSFPSLPFLPFFSFLSCCLQFPLLFTQPKLRQWQTEGVRGLSFSTSGPHLSPPRISRGDTAGRWPPFVDLLPVPPPQSGGGGGARRPALASSTVRTHTMSCCKKTPQQVPGGRWRSQWPKHCP